MLKEAIGVGATPELALEDACRQLGLESYEVKYELLEMPEKKILGLFGGRPAKVRAYVEEQTPAQAAVTYLKKILDGMGATNIEITVTEQEDGAELTLTGEDAAIVIGHHGETLSALQYLVGLVANHVQENYYRITLNTGNYREKREQTLQQLARRMASKAVATGRRQSLEPMNPYERRIIHTTVQEIEGASSWSEGVDMNRHVVIGPAEGSRPPRNNRNNRRGGGKYNNNRGGNRSSYNRDRAQARGEISQVEHTSTVPQEVEAAPVNATKPASVTTEKAQVPLYGRIEVKKPATQETEE